MCSELSDDSFVNINQMAKVSELEICYICYDEKRKCDMAGLPCDVKHRLCHSCIGNIFFKGPLTIHKCPFCRAEMCVLIDYQKIVKNQRYIKTKKKRKRKRRPSVRTEYYLRLLDDIEKDILEDFDNLDNIVDENMFDRLTSVEFITSIMLDFLHF